MVRRSAPPSSRCVANAWRSRCGCGARRRSVLVSRRRPRTERNSASFAPAAKGGRAGFAGGASSLARQRRTALAEVARHPERRLLAERDDALLAALAVAHVDELLLEVDVGEVEPDRLGAAQPGGVDELDERPVPQVDRLVAVERGELAVDVRLARRVREPAAAPRRDAGVGHACGAERMAEESPYRGELARDRGRREAARPAAGTRGAEVRGVLDEDADVDAVEVDSPPVQPAAELLDVDPVGAPRPLRQRGRGEEACGGGIGVHPGRIRRSAPAASAGPGSLRL